MIFLISAAMSATIEVNADLVVPVVSAASNLALPNEQRGISWVWCCFQAVATF